MSRVNPDILDGEVRLSTGGDSARRVFQVSEISGSPNARLANAARASGVPQKGDPHPVIDDINVLDVTARPTNDPTIAFVDVNYGVPSAADIERIGGEADIEITSDLITEETARDVSGNFLRTSYTLSVTTQAGTTDYEISKKIHPVEVQVPTFSVRFTRIESASAYDAAFRYSGRTNSSSFLSRPADAWLCTVSSTQQAPREHRVTYAFTYNSKGWQVALTHTIDGVIPDDLPLSSILTGQVYKRANFNQLGLPRL